MQSGIVIQAEVSDPVAAPANAKVLEVGSNEEIGNFVVLDLEMNIRYLWPVKGDHRCTRGISGSRAGL